MNWRRLFAAVPRGIWRTLKTPFGFCAFVAFVTYSWFLPDRLWLAMCLYYAGAAFAAMFMALIDDGAL